MADWRKIWGEISDSERFHSIEERGRLAYLQAYPKTDKEGRLPWSSKKLRALAFPLTQWSESDVENIRAELVRVGLWIYCRDAAGQEFVYVWRFEETQGEPKRRSREQASKFGDPINLPDCVPTVSPTDTEGTRNGHLDKIREEERRGEEIPRARTKSEDQANPEPGSRSNGVDTIGCRNAEWPYARGQIFDDFRTAINRFEWGPSYVDESAGKKAVDILQALNMRVTQMRVAYDRAMSDGKKHTHLFADTVQELRNGDCSQPKRTEAVASPTGSPAWLEEARKIDPAYFDALES